MILGWDGWLGIAMMAFGAAGLMVRGVMRLRAGHEGKWKAISSCVLSVILCLGGLSASLALSYSSDGFARTFKNAAPPSYLPLDWAPQLTAEERSRHSQMLAKSTFVNWGIHANYFDLKGAFVQYQPTDDDRLTRATRLNFIKQIEISISLFLWSAVGWALLPWLALAIAFMPWARPRAIALNSTKLG